MKTFADQLVEEGFRAEGFAYEKANGRVCQLHLYQWEGYFRPLAGPYHKMTQFWVAAPKAVKVGREFCFDERLRFMQWEKRNGLFGSIFEATLALAYSTLSKHQTGVMIQTWLDPAPTLTALSDLNFEVPFTVISVDGLRSEVRIAWFGEIFTLELSAFTFCDLIRMP